MCATNFPSGTQYIGDDIQIFPKTIASASRNQIMFFLLYTENHHFHAEKRLPKSGLLVKIEAKMKI